MTLLDGYIDRKQLAAELGVVERTLIAWERDKKGPPVTRVGRKVLYRRQAVAEWLLELEQIKPSIVSHGVPSRWRPKSG